MVPKDDMMRGMKRFTGFQYLEVAIAWKELMFHVCGMAKPKLCFGNCLVPGQTSGEGTKCAI